MGTKLCLRWANGECRFGDKCNFAHGETELRRLSGNNGLLDLNDRTLKNQFDEFKYNGRYIYDIPNFGSFGFTLERRRPFNVGPSAIHGPCGWTAYHDPATGDPYYHNHNTNITQWERPAEWSNS